MTSKSAYGSNFGDKSLANTQGDQVYGNIIVNGFITGQIGQVGSTNYPVYATSGSFSTNVVVSGNLQCGSITVSPITSAFFGQIGPDSTVTGPPWLTGTPASGYFTQIVCSNSQNSASNSAQGACPIWTAGGIYSARDIWGANLGATTNVSTATVTASGIIATTSSQGANGTTGAINAVNGGVNCSNVYASNNTTAGSGGGAIFCSAGGVSALSMWCGTGNFICAGAFASTSVINSTSAAGTNGAIQTAGGASIAKDVWIGGTLNLQNGASLIATGTLVTSSATAATSGGAGALQVAGGGYFGQACYLAKNCTVGGTFIMGATTTNAPNASVVGNIANVPAFTYTDNHAAYTLANFNVVSLGQVTLTSSNAVTTTAAATLYIDGPVIPSTNETFPKNAGDSASASLNYLNMGTNWTPTPNSFSLYVNKGISYFGAFNSAAGGFPNTTIATAGYICIGFNTGNTGGTSGAPQLSFMGPSGYPAAAFYIGGGTNGTDFNFLTYNDSNAKLNLSTQGGSIILNQNGSGQTQCRRPFYLPTAVSAIGIQSLTSPTPCAVYAGSGAPTATTGINNGDFYFRSDTPGTANQRLYIYNSGWTGIL